MWVAALSPIYYPLAFVLDQIPEYLAMIVLGLNLVLGIIRVLTVVKVITLQTEDNRIQPIHSFLYKSLT